MKQSTIRMIALKQSVLDFLQVPNTKLEAHAAVATHISYPTFVDYFDQLIRGGYFQEMGKVSCGSRSARKVFKTVIPTYVFVSSTEPKDTKVYPDHIHNYRFETDSKLQDKYRQLSQLYRAEMKSPKNYASGSSMSQL